MNLLIKGGRVIDPSRSLDTVGDVLIADGKVVSAGPEVSARKKGQEILDARGLVVAPGFVDMHVHLREPGHEEAETIATGARAALVGGFTSVACMANTDPVNDDRSVTEFIVAQSRRAGLANVFPIAAVTMGLQGKRLTNVGELREAGAVALSDDGKPVVNSELMRRAMSYARTFGMTVIEHCQDPWLSEGASINEGETSTLTGIKGMPNAAESVMSYRDIELAELTGAAIHIAHISTRQAAESVRLGKARGIRVSAEICPHHFALTDDVVRGYDTNTKMNPPLRTDDDVAAMLEAIKDGTIDCIASDHAPHHADKKAVEYDCAPFGIVGLETAVSVSLDRLVRRGVIDLNRLIEMFTINPARILGIAKGTLAPGVDGDVTLLDPDRRHVVDPEAFVSLSRNSPFAGMELRGSAVATVVGGRVLYDVRAEAGKTEKKKAKRPAKKKKKAQSKKGASKRA